MESNGSPGGGKTSPVITMFAGRGIHQYQYGLVIIILIIIVVLVTLISANGGLSILERLPISTIEDRSLPPGSVNETGYYTDNLGEMGGQWHLISELRRYYKITGVQPYIYITDRVGTTNQPTAQELMAYTDRLYDELFSDEAHILLFYFRSGDLYMQRQVRGTQAMTVVNTAAANELLDAVSRFINP